MLRYRETLKHKNAEHGKPQQLTIDGCEPAQLDTVKTLWFAVVNVMAVFLANGLCSMRRLLPHCRRESGLVETVPHFV